MYFASLIPSASQDQATIEVAVIALVGGLIGYLAKYYLDKKQAFSTTNADIKRKMYQGYLDELLKASSIGVGNLAPAEIKKIKDDFGVYSKSFYSTSVLFASPKVIKRYANFVRHTDKPEVELYQYELMLKSSGLYKAMRKDIGLSNRGLGLDGELLLRGNINDYDTTIGKYASWPKRMGRIFKKDSSKDSVNN